MSCDCMVTKATIEPITTPVSYQGNPRDPGTKSWCLVSLKRVECQPNDHNFWKIRESRYKLNENENENRERK